MVEVIVGCVGLYGERVDQASVGIKRLRPHIDRYVVIADESVTEEQKQKLRDLGCEVYLHPWEDSMVKMRNQYLEKCQTDDWIIVHDPDEWFCEKFCEDVRKICERAEKDDLALLLINSHDILYLEDGTKTESISDFYKNLIFRKREGTHYEGVGEVKEVHETLIIPGLTNAVRLPKEKYWYEHVKHLHEVWERAARNVFLAGGGNNVGERNPSWKPLRDIFDELGIHNWPEAREYLREGGIDPRLKMWLWANRFEGFDFDHEEMEFGRWYFEYLHPGEAEGWEPVTELEEGSPPEVMRYVEQTYIEVLGRHADQAGKEAYSNAILTGQLKREDLPGLIKRSPEYLQKVPGERVKMQVPVSVDVHITEEIFLEAMKKSQTYWKIIKPKMDIGSFVLNSLNDAPEGKEEFLNWFYANKEEVKLQDFYRKLMEVTEIHLLLSVGSLDEVKTIIQLIDSGDVQHNWEKHYQLKEGDIFVEGGAFWGRYVRKASKKVGSTGQVIAIEPSPENIRILKVLTEAEALENVTIVEKALWSEPGKEQFFIQENPASHQLKRLPLVKTGEMPPEEAEYVEVELDTIENILLGLGIDHVNLLSADIEGAGLAMLKGCGKYLDEKRIRNFAVAVYHMPRAKQEEFISILRNKDYEASLEDEGIVYAHL